MRAGLPTKEPVGKKNGKMQNCTQQSRQSGMEGKPHLKTMMHLSVRQRKYSRGHAMNKISKISLFVPNLCQIYPYILQVGILHGLPLSKYYKQGVKRKEMDLVGVFEILTVNTPAK